MRQRLTLVTLGVADLARSRRFYCEGLGFVPAKAGNEFVSFFDMGGALLSLYGRDALAEDAGLPAAGQGFRGVTLAHNVGSEAEVDAVFATALAAGAVAVKAPRKVFWGGYSGYFADPDGHLWEVAHNPFWPLNDEGLVRLPG